MLTDVDLANIATFCPRLERLTLNLCGRLDDDVLKAWSKGFKQLKYLSLYGASLLPSPPVHDACADSRCVTRAAPYLVTFGQWKEYLGTFGGEHQLEGFGLRQSARAFRYPSCLLLPRTPLTP